MQLVHATDNLSGTARDLGIGASALRKWKNAAQEDGDQAFPGQGRRHLTADQQDIKRLRQENEILRQEGEILKKVAACLGQNNTRMGLGGFFAKAVLPSLGLGRLTRGDRPDPSPPPMRDDHHPARRPGCTTASL